MRKMIGVKETGPRLSAWRLIRTAELRECAEILSRVALACRWGDVIQPLLEPGPNHHPALWRDGAGPVGEAGDMAQILADMVLADQADRDGAAIAVRDSRAEYRLSQKNAFGMVAQCPVSEVGVMGLGLIKPVVDRLIVDGNTAIAAYAGQRVVITVSHGSELGVVIADRLGAMAQGDPGLRHAKADSACGAVIVLLPGKTAFDNVKRERLDGI